MCVLAMPVYWARGPSPATAADALAPYGGLGIHAVRPDRQAAEKRRRALVAVEYVPAEPADVGMGELSFRLTNVGDRPITSLRGGIEVYGRSGGYLAGLRVQRDDEYIPPGGWVEESGVWGIGGRAVERLTTCGNELPLKFAIDEVVYDDGTVENFR